MITIDFKRIRILCSRRGGRDALGIERASQILVIFDTMGNGVVFDEDGTVRYARKKNLQRMFNYYRGSALARQFRTPITSADCPTTRSVEFLRTIPPFCPSSGPGTPVRGSRYLRLCTRWVRTFARVFSTFLLGIDFRSIINKRAELKSFIFLNFSIALQIAEHRPLRRS